MILLAIFAAIALSLFFLTNKSSANRRENRRRQIEERKEMLMEQLRQMKNKQHKGPDDEMSDTTKAE